MPSDMRLVERAVCKYAWFVRLCAVAMLLAVACRGSSGSANNVPADPERNADDNGHRVDDVSGGEADGAALIDEPDTAVVVASEAGECDRGQRNSIVGVVVSPEHPVVGQPMRVLAATLDGEHPLMVRVERADGTSVSTQAVARVGIPAATIANLVPSHAEALRVVVGRSGRSSACVVVRVAARRRVAGRSTNVNPWPNERVWTRAEEALYSAWIRELFHAPRGNDLAFRWLDEVTSERERNVLFDHLGLGEDARDRPPGLRLHPDCADTPYVLRAYYAWKRRLPFGFRQCSRGGLEKPVRCGSLIGMTTSVDMPRGSPESMSDELERVQTFLQRTVTWGVHSGNGRASFGDSRNDFYPLDLTRRALRPGTIYADPYGHILVVVALFPGNVTQPGVLYAIDGQPDGSITRKRFWEGNFLWNPDPRLGGSGFKAFRPVVVRERDGTSEIVSLDDREVARSSEYGDISDMQARLGAHDFYDLMDELVSPAAHDPSLALREAITALAEQVRVRVTSVGNADAYFATHPNTIIDMPSGFAVFETTGAWESYATPSRDLRLLIAIDQVVEFEAKLVRRPARYGVQPGQQLERLLERVSAERATLLADQNYAFTYARSNGSSMQIGLDELVARARALEVAYNPNDCAELRWGAPVGSEEGSTCTRRAPIDQRRKLAAYRTWFRERRRPARGDPGPTVRD